VTTPRRTGGLGRGLGALIPTGSRGDEPGAGESGRVAGARFAEVPVDRVTANPLQPRTHFDADAMAELVVSIREVGMLQPVVVREIEPDDAGARFELVMGERRWRAAREAGLDALPAIVRDTTDDDMLRDALLENLHRQQLNPLEEAAAYQQLLHEFGATHEELAARIGRSRPQITNTIRLLNLPPSVQRRVAAGVLSAGHARAILALPTPQAQEAMADRAVAEGMSVRGVEEAVHVAQGAGDEGKRSAPRGKRPVPAGLAEVADRLSDRLETRVKIDMGRSRGKVTIEFATVDDLQRIVAIMESGHGDVPAGVPAEVQHSDGQHAEGTDEHHHDGEHHEHHGGDHPDGGDHQQHQHHQEHQHGDDAASW
jgi:ParB family chromosome partitioning protein